MTPRRFILWCAVAVLSVTLFMLAMGCAPLPASIPAQQNVSTGRFITLLAGQRLEVRLPVQLGTGYIWQLERDKRYCLKPDGEPVVDGDALMPGGKQIEVFYFDAVAMGLDRLDFDYGRPGQKPIKRFTVIAKVVRYQLHEQPQTKRAVCR